ncbi:hypothetical protein Pmani_023696 [Petrolisthes manimaculis]|uniref:Uncharacterized protein n=1 Tax=Petrolisthes manimaculis TaxID=1843537 RepID=A0AAE1PBH7_9EUCA|nr:hypothetical protein Pmani_023696 [Petrolisthes manimaculis]
MDQSDISQCVASRSRQGITTWLAFVGDSTMRQKVHTLLLNLPQNLQYTYFLGTKQVNASEFRKAVTFHKLRPPTFDIIGKAVTVPPQHDGKLEPSSSTNTTTTPTNPNPSSSPDDAPNFNPYLEIHDEYPTSETNPVDPKFNAPLWEGEVQLSQFSLRVTLVWSPGTWDKRENIGTEINKFEEWLDGPSLPHVIVIGLSTWNILSRNKVDELSPATQVETFARHFLHSLTRLADRTTVLYWRQSRRTAVWLWDSTLPFNLANIRECLRLNEANMFNHPLYTGRWWNCGDSHHSSYETNYVDIQMLFNFLCNDYMESSEEGPYCC